MRRRLLSCLVVIVLSSVAPNLRAAVEVFAPRAKKTKRPEGVRHERPVTLSNATTKYTLMYDIIRTPGKDTVTSHQWIWKSRKYVTLGMTAPSGANWYVQGFFDWRFDGVGLYDRPASARVVRRGGADGMVEYVWETPSVTATIRFALTTGSDKLLMFASYKPKRAIKQSSLHLICYPSFFKPPRKRSVTTTAGTVKPGTTLTLDLARQRWVLYEDATVKRRKMGGSAGLLIGTPKAFSKITVPVGSYGMETRLDLKPGKRSFALGLYDYPPMPELEMTRAYFRKHADAEAAQIGAMAAGDLDKPLPARPIPKARRDILIARARKAMDRPVDVWRALPEPLDFPWAKGQAAGPIKTVLFCPRWSAYETMDLARRVDLDVKHLYWDNFREFISKRPFPYATQTGVNSLEPMAAHNYAMALTGDETNELFIIAGIESYAVPKDIRTLVTNHVKKGKSLLLAGSANAFRRWPKELFTKVDAAATKRLAESMSAAKGLAARVSTCGKGCVVSLEGDIRRSSTLAPYNDASEGFEYAYDRVLALAAQAALTATGRAGSTTFALTSAKQGVNVSITPSAPRGATLTARITDDLDRLVTSLNITSPGKRARVPVALPGGRLCTLDLVLRDRAGRCLAMASKALPKPDAASITTITVQPAHRVQRDAAPLVDLPRGGTLRCSARITNRRRAAGAHVRWEVYDAFDRLVGQATTPLPSGNAFAMAALAVTRPVTVCHRLDVSLVAGERTLAVSRLRFTMPVPYPHDDFTTLMWIPAGAAQVLRRTRRLCYDLGSDMGDLANMMGGRADTDAVAAREYERMSRSGLRLLPYISRIAPRRDGSKPSGIRVPCLHDPAYLKAEATRLTIAARQTVPYEAVGFTLGDENTLMFGRDPIEVCRGPHTLKAFHTWLRARYRTVARLNTTWGSKYKRFSAITEPMRLADAAKQTTTFAPWLDHRRFMDDAFADTHRLFANIIRKQVPGARVGWDGFLGYHWQAGYDFAKLCRGLDMLQTYARQWGMGSYVRSFKEPGAVTGKWGNRVAYNDPTFKGVSWHGLLDGDSSVWWWTSWGCYYTPFNPDLSPSPYQKPFFEGTREVGAGPGKLLRHAAREHSSVGVLYNHPDVLMAAVLKKMKSKAPMAGTTNQLRNMDNLARAVVDLGSQFRFISYLDLEDGKVKFPDYKVILLSLAMVISDEQATALTKFVEDGGTLIADTRSGLLDGDGRMRTTGALDNLLGKRGQTGLTALKQKPVAVKLAVANSTAKVLDPTLKPTTAKAVLRTGGHTLLLERRVGKGRAVTANVLWGAMAMERFRGRERPLSDLLANQLHLAGVAPFCEVSSADNARPRAIQQVMFTDGRLRYLALQVDLMSSRIKPQSVRVTLPKAAIVYDLRAGKRVGRGAVKAWDATLAVGEPKIYALMPYAVTAVAAETPGSARRGRNVAVRVSVAAGRTKPGHHVVRMDVFAPGSATPHRQYSQNIACPDGHGEADIPLAVNDPAGQWTLRLRDVATGMSREVRVTAK